MIRNPLKNRVDATLVVYLSQQDVSFEYIIVDGKSMDGTEEFLKSLTPTSNVKVKIICEKDKGVYDAMNKGIHKVSGKYTIFMNSGDYFASNDVLAKVYPYLTSDADVVYGDTLMRYGGGNFINKPSNPTEENPMPFIHQSALVKTELLIKHPFDQSYKILADHKFFYTLNKEGSSYAYVPIVISSYNAQQGLSAENPYQQHIEHASIHGLDKSKLWFLRKLFYMLRFGLHMRLRRLLPAKLENRLVLISKRKIFQEL